MAKKAEDKVFKLKPEDGYFRALSHGVPITGTIDVNDEDTFNLIYDLIDVDDEEDPYIEFDDEYTVYASTLADYSITSFKVIDKTEYTQLTKEYGKRFFNFGGYTVRPIQIDGKPGRSFGCGAVKLTDANISNFVKVRNMFKNEEEWGGFMEILDEISNHGFDIIEPKELKILNERFLPSNTKKK